MDGGVMRMRPVQKIDLPARKTVKLAPGGLHIMLLDIKQPLKEGDMVPLVLTFQGKGKVPSTVKVEAQVRAMGAASMRNH
jgi:copper(I)-binding protein